MISVTILMIKHIKNSISILMHQSIIIPNQI